MIWVTFGLVGGMPVDARCFYDADPANPYWRTAFAFFYSPAAAQAMVPLHLLSFEAFVALVRAAELVALFALTGPLLPLVVFWSPVASELNAANINLLIVAVGVWGLRWPALWSFVLLTKVTPGIGLLWFAARREWRQLAIAVGATGAIAVLSLALAPGLWLDWIAFMTTIQPSDGVPLWARVLGAALLVVWGGRTDRRWTVVLAVVIATPRTIPDDPGDAGRPALLRAATSRSDPNMASVGGGRRPIEAAARDAGRGGYPTCRLAAGDPVGHQPLDLGPRSLHGSPLRPPGRIVGAGPAAAIAPGSAPRSPAVEPVARRPGRLPDPAARQRPARTRHGSSARRLRPAR